MSTVWLIILTCSFPFLAGLLMFIFRNKWVLLTLNLFAVFFSVMLVTQKQEWVGRFEWMPGIQLGWKLDYINTLLLFLVSLISGLVHTYSAFYIKKNEQPRYFIKLGFFTSSMLGLLLADHLILMFMFWELVGFSSYLLIGFWYKKEDTSESAKWAFITNRVADVALLSAILYLGVNNTFFISEMDTIGSTWIGWGLVIGAMGKSAQLPFSPWLARAMSGPTPVSALLHAATMVTAGVYLLIRIGSFLPIDVLNLVAVIGALTAFYGAFSAYGQDDVKKVFAYSTVSQLGYMFLAVGVGAIGSSFFHLWTHAFFKAGLFLTAGTIILQFGTQDMREMGHGRKGLNFLAIANLVFILALVGIPLFTGFNSKEGILASVWAWASTSGQGTSSVFYLAFFTILLTALYAIRQWVLTFGSRTDFLIKVKSAPLSSLVIVGILATSSLWFFVNLDPLSSESWVLHYSNMKANHASLYLTLASISIGAIGLAVSCYYFRTSGKVFMHYADISRARSVVGKMSFSGLGLDASFQAVGRAFYWVSIFLAWTDRQVDTLVDSLGVSGVVLSRLLAAVDRFVIDGVVNLSSLMAKMLGRFFARIQSSQVQQQLLWMILGLIFILFGIISLFG